MKTSVFKPINANEFVVAVDAFGSSVSGCVYHESCAEGIAFDSVPAFALVIENILDVAAADDGFAQSVDGLRSAATQAAPRTAEGGALATFRLEVMFRQHCSWQGKLTWVECNQEANFRSFLELLLLMNDVMAGETA